MNYDYDYTGINPGTVDATSTEIQKTNNCVVNSYVSDYSRAKSFNEWVESKFGTMQGVMSQLSAGFNAASYYDGIEEFSAAGDVSVFSCVPIENVNIYVPYSTEALANFNNYAHLPDEDKAVIQHMYDQLTANGVYPGHTDEAIAGYWSDYPLIKFHSNLVYSRPVDMLDQNDYDMSDTPSGQYLQIKPVEAYYNIASGVGIFSTVDDLLDGLQQSNQVAQTIIEGSRAIVSDLENTATEGIAKATSFLDKIKTKALDTGTKIMALVDGTLDICKNGGLSVKDKITSLLTLGGLITPTSQDESTNPFTTYSQSLSGITGTSPICLHGDAIIDTLAAIDPSSVGNAIGSAFRNVGKAIGVAFGGISKGIGKLAHKIKTSISNPDDFVVNSNSGSPTVGNLGYQFQLSSYYSDIYRQYLSADEYIVFSLPGGDLYLWLSDHSASSDVCGLIQWNCATRKHFYENFERVYSSRQDVGSAEFDEQLLADLNQSLDEEVDPTSDQQAMLNIHKSKKDLVCFVYYLAHTCISPIMCSYYFNTGYSLLQCVNAMYSDIAGFTWDKLFDVTATMCYNSPSTDPDNAQLANELVQFVGNSGNTRKVVGRSMTTSLSAPAYKFNNESFLVVMVDILLRYTNNDWTYSFTATQGVPVEWDCTGYCTIKFLPYYHSTSATSGRYSLKTDSDNARAYGAFLALFLITTAAVIIGAKFLKAKIKAHENIDLLKAQLGGDSYHMSEALMGNQSDMKYYFGKAGINNVITKNGRPSDPKQIARMNHFWRKENKKKRKKLNRLEKLAGLTPVAASVAVSNSMAANADDAAGYDLNDLIMILTGDNSFQQ